MAINNIKQLKDNGTQFYPETHIEAVIDGDGNTLGELQYNNFRLMAYAFGQVDSETTATSPEWTSVVTDADGKVLAGIMVDGTVYFADI